MYFIYDTVVFVWGRHANAEDINNAMATAKHPWIGANKIELPAKNLYYTMFLNKEDAHLLRLFFDYTDEEMYHVTQYGTHFHGMSIINEFDDVSWRT